MDTNANTTTATEPSAKQLLNHAARHPDHDYVVMVQTGKHTACRTCKNQQDAARRARAAARRGEPPAHRAQDLGITRSGVVARGHGRVAARALAPSVGMTLGQLRALVLLDCAGLDDQARVQVVVSEHRRARDRFGRRITAIAFDDPRPARAV